MYGQTGRPSAAKSFFITALSIPTADPSTPAPTYGTLASSRSPCTVPSSPYGPCRTGKTTSMRARSTAAVGSTVSSACDPVASTTSAADSAVGAWAPRTHWPCFSMKMGMGSYRARSRCLKIDAAEATDTSCSPERPPYTTATRILFTVELSV